MDKLISEIIDKCNGPYEDENLAVIEVNGKDNKKFLQGQLTNDIVGLDPEKYSLSSYCTHQGKVIANVQVLLDDDKVLLLLPKSIISVFIEKISKYILMSDVEFIHNTEAKVLSIVGEEATKRLANEKIQETYAYKKIYEKNILINMSTSFVKLCRYIVLDSKADSNIKIKLYEGTYTCLIDLFNLFTRLNENNIEKFIPQVLNADKLNTINYKKGCYTGQEVVARTHYLGSVKKHVYLGFLNVPNNDEKNIINNDGESVGELIGDILTFENNLLSHCILRDSCNFEDLYINNNKLEIITMEDIA